MRHNGANVKRAKQSTWNAEMFENYLLLVGQRLLHEDHLDALFHRILLRSVHGVLLLGRDFRQTGA